MKEYEIHPRKGVNSVVFGMTQAQVEEVEPGGDFLAVRNQSPEFLTYVITDENSEQAFYYFDNQGLLREIEFSGRCRVGIADLMIGGLSASRLKELLLKLDQEVGDDSDGFKSDKLGVYVWIESAEDDQVGSILVSR